METQRLTAAQALVRFLDQQYIRVDGREIKFVEGIATVFGHGNVLGLGQALDEYPGALRYFQGKNEQGMAHAAAAFARQHCRHKIIAVSSSIGPGAANMITAAAAASVDNIPLLLLPGDSFASRQPDPVLQQVEFGGCPSTTTNDAFRAVCRYWDRVQRPEQLMSAMVQAMRVLTDPAEAGAVCVALPQDVQAESFDFPVCFLQKRIHSIPRPLPPEDVLEDAAAAVARWKKPLVICGGGVKYSGAGEALRRFCRRFGIPMAETQAGKSAVPSSEPLNLGGIGATGNAAANSIAARADGILAVGSRLTDFTTSSKWLFQNPAVSIVSVNISRFHAYKMDALPVVGDAKAALEALTDRLAAKGYRSGYAGEIEKAKADWHRKMERLAGYTYDGSFRTLIAAQNPGSVEQFARQTGSRLTQTAALCKIRSRIAPDAVIVGAAGSLPGDLQRMWETDAVNSYHMEYGYSCMGYEIAAALGVKLAQPEREVYAMCGDGSFYMLHSELVTAVQENVKINILLFDNAGFGCINNLEMGNGVGSLGTEFRRRGPDGRYSGEFLQTDFAAVAEGYGAKGYSVRTMEELDAALRDSREQTRSTLIDIKVLPKTMTADYGSWWHVGVASVSGKEDVRKAFERKESHRRQARPY